jgi:hypothetical protein
LTLLAAAALSSSAGNSTMNNVEPGLLGFLVVAGIGVALVFLLRSMNKQFRKLGPPPEESQEAQKAQGTQAGAADAEAERAKRG